MTEQEFAALVAILNRAPMTPAEALWLTALLERLRPKPVSLSEKMKGGAENDKNRGG